MSKTPIIIESVESDKTEWLLSFSDSNPLAKDCFFVSNSTEAKKAKGLINEYTAAVSVAFAEWKDGEKFLYCYMGEGVYKYIHAKLGAFTPSDLYQYWIENVYNK